MTARNLTLVLIGVVIVGSIVYLESRKADTGGIAEEADIILDSNERRAAKAKQYEPAKDITTPDGFINTEPFSLEELVGEKVILVDFWTYSCINCQRTLPYLNSWHESYADDGLVIVGVHTPEFEFEKEYDNVLAAVEKFGVNYPVVLDNDYSTWRSYNNRYWPRKYLIDIDGFIVYDHIGEGAYEETEAKIVAALEERIEVLGLDEEVEDDAGEVTETEKSGTRTPEIYFGSDRVQHLVNLPEERCLADTCTYELPDTLPLHGYALKGKWTTTSERIAADSPGSIQLHFEGREVNIVAGAPEGVTATVLLDGVVTHDALRIEAHTLYNLADLEEAAEHILEIRFDSPGVEVFTFTFG